MVAIIAPAATIYLADSPQNNIAASAKGAFDCAKTSGGIIPMIAIELRMYTMMVTTVPNMVAFLIVVSAFSILELGMVALSIPKKANKVSVVVAVIAEMFDSPLRLNGMK